MFELGIGGGDTVQVEEPERSQFTDNLGGAFEYSITHFVYSTLEFMGGAMGSWLAGVLVNFLDSVEPALVVHVAPLLDMLLEIEELPDHLRDFFTQLQAPTSAAGATILAGLAATTGGSVAGGIVGSMSALWTYPINRGLRLGRPGAGEIPAMQWRGSISVPQAEAWFHDLGYPDLAIEGYRDILRPRVDIAGMVNALFRGKQSTLQVTEELSRRGMAQPDIALILETAYTYLPVETMMAAYLRGEKSLPAVRADLTGQGLRTQDIDNLLALSQIIPNPTDLISMAVREAWDDRVAEQWGYDADFPEEFASWSEKVGLTREWSKRYWRAHWRLPSVQLGYEMMHRGIISIADLEELLRISDYPEGWRDKMVEVAYHPYTRVDVRRMYKVGILDRESVKQAYLDLGYDAEKAEGMTLFTEIYSPPEDATPKDEYKLISRSIVERAYRVGKLSKAEATTRLMDLEYSTEDIELLLSLVKSVKELDETPDMLAEFRRDMKSIIERAFEKRVIGPEIALDMLVDLGYSANEGEFILLAVNAVYQQKTTEKRLSIIGKAYVLRAISKTRVYELLGTLNLAGTEQAQIMAEWDVEREIRDRPLTESQYRKYLTTKLKEITEGLGAGEIGGGEYGQRLSGLVEEYSENLRGLGYTEKAIGILTYLAVPEVRG